MRVRASWPLVGREFEVDLVSGALADPGGGLAVIYGPAGVGKTRVAEASLHILEQQRRPTARAIASHSAATLPLGALAPILPAAHPSDPSPAAIFEHARREVVRRGAGEHLTVFVDDAHLLDTASAVLLTHLLDAQAVRVVATIRDGEPLPDAVAGWWRRGNAVRLDLGDLDRGATAEILAGALGGDVVTETVHNLHAASHGNPLLLRALVHQALEDGQLGDATGTWRLTGDIEPSRRIVDVMATRLAALDPAVRGLLEQLVVCAPLGVDELAGEVAVEELEALERSGLLRVVVDGRRHQLVLGHPLYGEALRADLPVLRRRAILLDTAGRVEALSARRREDARRVATWQLDAGTTPDRELLLNAARHARYAYDYAQVERLSSILWSLEHTAEVAVLLGEAHCQLGHFEEAEAILSAPLSADSPGALLMQRGALRGQNLQWGLGDTDAALAVVKDDQVTMGAEHADDLAIREAGVWHFASRPQKALDILDRVAPDTPRSRVLIAIVSGQALARVGRTAEAIEASVSAYAEHLALAEPLAMSHPGIHIINQAYALMEAGRFSEGDELGRLGYDVAHADNIPFGLTWFSLALGKSCTQQGRLDEARQWLQGAASTAGLHGLHGPERTSLCGLAAVEAVLGNAVAARAALDRAGALAEFEFLRFDEPTGWAWTAWAEGEPERARRILLSGAAAAAEWDNIGAAAMHWHDAARLGAGNVGPHLVGLAERADSLVVAARAAHVLALEADDGDALGAASTAFEDLGMVLLATEAACAAADAYRRRGLQRPGANLARRAQALAQRHPGAHTPGLQLLPSALPLSAREREVAALAGRGLTSQEIAERLFLSVRTVNNHLGNVYAKLGINGRDELADALVQSG
ncbi:MAG: hypothetical protein JWM47_744 [Acidimicrobiales bacterium]|nr:hypothetical protein [Acidimicrobiales bacterium]